MYSRLYRATTEQLHKEHFLNEGKRLMARFLSFKKVFTKSIDPRVTKLDQLTPGDTTKTTTITGWRGRGVDAVRGRRSGTGFGVGAGTRFVGGNDAWTVGSRSWLTDRRSWMMMMMGMTDVDWLIDWNRGTRKSIQDVVPCGGSFSQKILPRWGRRRRRRCGPVQKFRWMTKFRTKED